MARHQGMIVDYPSNGVTRARTDAAPLYIFASPGAPHAFAVQRQLLSDDHGGRIWLQPLARYRGDALARRCDVRRVRFVRVLARRSERSGVVGRLSTRRP